MFLWKGDKVHDTLTLLLQSKGFTAMNHGIYVEVVKTTKKEVTGALDAVIGDSSIDALEVAAGVQNKMREKWDVLLPPDVLDAGFASGNLDVAGALSVLRTVLPLGETDPAL